MKTSPPAPLELIGAVETKETAIKLANRTNAIFLLDFILDHFFKKLILKYTLKFFKYLYSSAFETPI